MLSEHCTICIGWCAPCKGPHKRLPEYPIIPREKTHSGAAVREKTQDAPVKERWGPSFPAPHPPQQNFICKEKDMKSSLSTDVHGMEIMKKTVKSLQVILIICPKG